MCLNQGFGSCYPLTTAQEALNIPSSRTQGVNVARIVLVVPQGSVLGPTLFIIYIKGLPTIKLNDEYILFVDNTMVSFASDSPSPLHQPNSAQ